MNPRRRIYIAGPMHGYPDNNYPAFIAAEEYLKGLGYAIENPARTAPEFQHRTPNRMELDEIIKADLEKIMECTGMYMLNGWETSIGAMAEFHLARWLGIKIFYEAEIPQ